MTQIAIRVHNIGKRYQLAHRTERSYRTLREDIAMLPLRLFNSLARSTVSSDDFWALENLTFNIERGDILGVIGRNGAGKSTLLKIISRIVEPTVGEIDINGRIGSLLEVGTGFHPELTGRENIFLSGAILGMKRSEIAARFDEIVSFAEVERFIDTPCKHYSSGMYTRLGFSVAAHLDADILLVDEVLAVGDMNFKERCSKKMAAIARSSERTVIVVSHETGLIRSLCTRVLLLEKGSLAYYGHPDEALRLYQASNETNTGKIVDAIARKSDGIRVESIKVLSSEARQNTLAANQRELLVEIEGTLSVKARISLEVKLCDSEGRTLGLFSPGHETGKVPNTEPGKFIISNVILLPRLLRGMYELSIYLTEPNVSGWVDAPSAVRLSVEGCATPLGVLPSGSHCGWMLLEGANQIPARDQHVR